VDEQEYSCEVGDSTGLVYVIASDTMGRGDDTLGRSLLKTFMQTIKDVSPLPSKIIFYNSGVKLVCEGSAALDALRYLQEKGVNILVCGTCLEFYELKAEIQVGQISNMYEIMTTMMEASRVVSPQ
jgi:selenium metabolism protein YedF